MRHAIVIFLLVWCNILSVYAQTDEGSKILIFRNTGEINILNTDSVSKVELTTFDTDSIEHEEFVSQVFHRMNGEPLFVPISEIDSVAFGVRNYIQPKKDVRRLTDEEVAAIKTFDGQSIEYDSRLKLRQGETVYYDCLTEILPIGLCVRVDEVNETASGYKAMVTICDPADVFDRYLITGEEIGYPVSKKTRMDYDEKPFELSFEDVNGWNMEGEFKLSLNMDATDVVIDVLKKYYHATIKLYLSNSIEFKILTKDSGEINFESPMQLNFSLPLFNGALKCDIDLDGFVDIKAEAGIEYSFAREYAMTIEWTRKNGENHFSKPILTQNPLGDLEQKTEVHLNGEVFLGPRLNVSINTPFNLAGAGFETKMGPKLDADFSLGVLATLTDKYDEEAYGKANINFSLGTRTETYVYHHTFSYPPRNYIKLPFSFENFIELFTLPIFPEIHSKAVLSKSTENIVQKPETPEVVSVSTFTETELPYPLDISFELADKVSDEPISEVIIDDLLEANEPDSQNLSAEIDIPAEIGTLDKEKVVVRPIINYKGYRVKAPNVDVAGDMLFTPLVAALNSNSTYFICGMTPVSQHSYEDVTFIEGNLIAFGTGDPRHKKKTFTTISFVDLSDLSETHESGYSHPLLGKWSGNIKGEPCCFNFLDSSTGTYNDIPFTYSYNSPTKGGIAIKLEDHGTISFNIVDLSDDTMEIIMKGATNKDILIKK